MQIHYSKKNPRPGKGRDVHTNPMLTKTKTIFSFVSIAILSDTPFWG